MGVTPACVMPGKSCNSGTVDRSRVISRRHSGHGARGLHARSEGGAGPAQPSEQAAFSRARLAERRFPMRDLSWVGAGVVVLAIGCASSAPPPTTEKTVPGAQYLLGSEWELRDLGGTPVLPDRRPTLSFVDPGRISGSASCNRYGGGADLGAGTLKVGRVQTTRTADT
ncbi:MAG: META domain-containing protein, partial [Myxococcaceae bacterium]